MEKSPTVSIQRRVERNPMPNSGNSVSFDVIEELAKGWMSLAGFMNTHMLLADMLLRFGTDEQKQRYLPVMATGELRGGLCITEPDAGTDVQAISTRAVRDGDEYVLNGAKTLITNGRHGGLFAVVCKTDPTARAKGISLVMIETQDLEGFSRNPPLSKIGMRGQDTCELFFDDLHRTLYATDASVYRKMPLAVAFPKSLEDIKVLIIFAKANNTSLIPRTAGTSLAGQCVGEGIVVDVSKHFTEIIALDAKNKTVTVQPGVIRDELNRFLKPHGLFFGPNTSTSNRCMIGGMVGNNSSGTTSIQYGVTRDNVIQVKALLSDASEVVFEAMNTAQFLQKRKLKTLEEVPLIREIALKNPPPICSRCHTKWGGVL